MIIDRYELEQNKAYANKILNLFNIDVPLFQNKIQTNTEFLEKYNIKELYLKIIKKFDYELHLPNSKKLLHQSIIEWNRNNPSKIIEINEIIKKYYLLESKEFAVFNPYLLKKKDTTINILQFYGSDRKRV